MIQYPLAPEEDISIHASREGGDEILDKYCEYYQISIHASREGGDWSFVAFISSPVLFQSTPPVREATFCRFLIL